MQSHGMAVGNRAGMELPKLLAQPPLHLLPQQNPPKLQPSTSPGGVVKPWGKATKRPLFKPKGRGRLLLPVGKAL